VGGAPAAGTVTGLGRVCGRLVMVVANDATVKAGAFFPLTAKKVIRAQNISIENHIPTSIWSIPRACFSRCRKMSSPTPMISGASFAITRYERHGIPQITPSWECVWREARTSRDVRSHPDDRWFRIISRGTSASASSHRTKISAEELGGAKMHAEISGTVDFREPDDESCLQRIRALVDKMGHPLAARFDYKESEHPAYPPEEIYGIFSSDPAGSTTCAR